MPINLSLQLGFDPQLSPAAHAHEMTPEFKGFVMEEFAKVSIDPEVLEDRDPADLADSSILTSIVNSAISSTHHPALDVGEGPYRFECKHNRETNSWDKERAFHLDRSAGVPWTIADAVDEYIKSGVELDPSVEAELKDLQISIYVFWNAPVTESGDLLIPTPPASASPESPPAPQPTQPTEPKEPTKK